MQKEKEEIKQRSDALEREKLRTERQLEDTSTQVHTETHTQLMTVMKTQMPFSFLILLSVSCPGVQSPGGAGGSQREPGEQG